MQPAYESNKLGIDADINCKTRVDGLFAAGMARTLGINPFTGWSITACTWSGYRAGESASSYAGDADFMQVVLTDMEHKLNDFYGPLKIEKGVDPDALVLEIQKILFPVNVLIIMSERNLKAALDKILVPKNEKLPYLRATDTRSLIKVRETQTMLLSAEMTLRASLMRKETRKNIFYREDYSRPDNTNWLKWITAEKGRAGEMVFSSRPIPFKIYAQKPGTGEKDHAR